MQTTQTLIQMVLLAALTSPAEAEELRGYGPRLEGFDYPHPVQYHAFTSQRQAVEMAYLDLPPTADALGQTVLLLHGKNFCAATWEATIATLRAAGYRVVAPDQIGFCKSTKPETYQFTLQQLAANTVALLQTLGIETTHVVGHSMGGMLAVRLALMHPEMVQQLVLVNPIGLEDWQAKGVPAQTLDEAYASELDKSYADIKEYQQRFYYNGDWQPGYDRWARMLAGLHAGPGRELAAWNQAQTAEMVFTQPVVHELGKLAVPTTLLIGGKDRTAPGANRAPAALQETLGNYPQLGREAAAAIPDATLVEWPELGHTPQLEAPDRFHAALLEALRGSTAQAEQSPDV